MSIPERAAGADSVAVSVTPAPGRHRIGLTVNGRRREADVEPRLLLSDLLRDKFELPGTHVGCEQGVCGSCTVHLDGTPVRACLLFAVQCDGREVTTVEGLADRDTGALHPLQEAFHQAHALQCGYCTPGMLMVLADLLERRPAAGEAEVRAAIAGNLCRCTGYQHIADAVLAVVRAVPEPPA